MNRHGKLLLLFAWSLLVALPVSSRVRAVASVGHTPDAVLVSGDPEQKDNPVAEEQQDRDQEKRDRAQEARDREHERRDREAEKRDRENALYERGTEALDENRWESALEAFGQLGSVTGSRADGALYWKAYAQNKLGRRGDALATLAELQKSFPNSRWVNDARALGVEIRQASGAQVSPESESNEDLKLIAINSLLNSDPERAVPMLEKLLQSNQSPRLKQRALFVLCQSGSPRAREVVAEIARGKSNPDLQMRAIQYVALFGGKESQQTLSGIYAASNDTDVKRAILRGFMVSGGRDRLLAAAKSEKNADLRMDAIGQLGVMGAEAELWQLYQVEPSVEAKEKILHALFIGGKAERLIEVARNEKDSTLRRAAVHSLGLMGSERTGDALVSIYKTEKAPEIRREILGSLFIQGNAKALVVIARAEKDPELRKRAIERLSLMGSSKEATDFMLELLNK